MAPVSARLFTHMKFMEGRNEIGYYWRSPTPENFAHPSERRRQSLLCATFSVSRRLLSDTANAGWSRYCFIQRLSGRTSGSAGTLSSADCEWDFIAPCAVRRIVGLRCWLGTSKVGTHKKTVIALWVVLIASVSFGVYKNFTAIDQHTTHEKEIIELRLQDTNGIENFVKNFSARRYRTDKFSFVLSEVQNGNFNQYKAWKSNYYQRARRKDAEPIICRLL